MKNCPSGTLLASITSFLKVSSAISCVFVTAL
jgi:hypothetical protein